MQDKRVSAWILGVGMFCGATAHAVNVPPAFTGSTAPNWVLYDDAKLTADPAVGIDPDGSGWLRLTPDVAKGAPPYVKGSAIYNQAFSSSDGIQATFQYATYRDSSNPSSNPLADGMSFYLYDGSVVSTPGAGGGALGYSSSTETTPATAGITGGYVGVGFAEWGAFSLPMFGGGCSSSAPVSAGCDASTRHPGITVRGAGTGTSDYLQLAHKDATIATNGRGGVHTVRVTVTPAPSVLLTIEMDANDGNGFVTYIDKLPLGTINGAPPSTFKLGFSAANGQLSATHEVRFLGIQGARKPVVTLGANNPGCGAVTLTATVAGDGAGSVPSGKVNFVGQNNVVLGSATIDATTSQARWTGLVPDGVQNVVAQYVGDDVYVAGASAALAQVALPACAVPVPLLEGRALAVLALLIAALGSRQWLRRAAKVST